MRPKASKPTRHTDQKTDSKHNSRSKQFCKRDTNGMDTNLKQTEQVVMLAILRKQPDAYGVSIHEELAKRLGSEVPMATIYATLEKLQTKGFIKSRQGEATAERGGRAKMYFNITGKGQAALNASLNALDRLRGIKVAGAMA
uniref:Helix-turn-helix transcriptional regulator n=1 Tax=Bradyrhizobium quebecense TaxID=2748629 RepID=A0ABS3MV53_9BRAD